jgi:hypothetical protein
MDRGKFLAIGFIVLAATLVSFAAMAAVPNLINYQGQLIDVAGPVTDPAVPMVFRIYDTDTGGTPLWEESQTVDVQNGIYNVLLGSGTRNTSYGYFDPSLFSGENRWFEVVVDGELLEPRQRVTSVAFAMKSADSDFLEGFDSGDFSKIGHHHDTQYVNEGQTSSVNSAMIANFSITAADIQDGATRLEILDDDGPGSSLDADFLDGYTSSYFMPATTDKWVNITGDTMTGALNMVTTGTSINVDANTTNTHVYGVRVDADQSAANNYYIYGLYSDTDSSAASGYTYGTYSNAAGNYYSYGVLGIGTSVTRTAYGLYGQASLPSGNNYPSYGLTGSANTYGNGHAYGTSTSAYHYGTSGTAFGTYSYANGSDNGDAYGVSSTAYKSSSDTSGTAYGGYFTGDNDRSTGNSYGLYGRALGTGGTNYGVYALAQNGNTNYGVFGKGTTYGGNFESDSTGVRAQGVYTGIYATATSTSTAAKNAGYFYTNGVGNSVYGRADGENGIGLHGYGQGANGTGVKAWGRAKGLQAQSWGSGSYGVYATSTNVALYASSGVYAAEFRGNVIIKEWGSGNTVMELGAGLDYAEGFDVSDEFKIEPGTVLIIDSENPGKLTKSKKAYDKRVAGIVAGAKGQGSGIRLGAGQFDYDVALAGRVFCKVDATYGAVEPGDILTTSDTPGYAMKSMDPNRDHGAILGKAMEPLEDGQRGQILVLVTLQ